MRQIIDIAQGILVLLRRKLVPTTFKDFDVYQTELKNKKGIEIGGPSAIFSQNGQLALYHIVAALDGVNFSTHTIWEGKLKQGKTYKYGNNVGNQFILEADDLKGIKANTYDFLITSHCLEHTANPLKALNEWRRVVKKNGLLIIVLPRKEYTFDHRRDFTKFNHIKKDYVRDTKETDTSHFAEIIQKHNVFLDFASGGYDAFVARTKDNITNRSIHHHVYSPELLNKMCREMNIEVLESLLLRPFHQIIIGKKQ